MIKLILKWFKRKPPQPLSEQPPVIIGSFNKVDLDELSDDDKQTIETALKRYYERI